MADEQPIGEEFFMRIKNPLVFRRNLLESSKIVLGILKQTYSIKQIRDAKLRLIHIINNEIKELKILVQKINEIIPQYDKDELKNKFPDLMMRREVQIAEMPEEHIEEKEHEPPQHHAEEPVSDIEKLNKALDDVQKKLKNL